MDGTSLISFGTWRVSGRPEEKEHKAGKGQLDLKERVPGARLTLDS